MEAGTDSWTDGQVGMSLVVGDSVKTGNDSSAAITFLDGNTMELEADTEIEITSVDVSTDTGGTTVTITHRSNKREGETCYPCYYGGWRHWKRHDLDG